MVFYISPSKFKIGAYLEGLLNLLLVGCILMYYPQGFLWIFFFEFIKIFFNRNSISKDKETLNQDHQAQVSFKGAHRDMVVCIHSGECVWMYVSIYVCNVFCKKKQRKTIGLDFLAQVQPNMWSRWVILDFFLSFRLGWVLGKKSAPGLSFGSG